ncbi:MAG: glycosyltransferase family 9 protein [Chloroflexi bacterium]|nr:glycosyltransferase family 9 protein [Chloroflexota bacterium]
MSQPQHILVIKLSDIGDVLTATPALRALRQTFSGARIDILVPPGSAGILSGSTLIDEVIVFDKFVYDEIGDALGPGAVASALSFFRQLRTRRYDTLVLLHHLSTRWGALKWQLLAGAVGAPVRAGLDNGRGGFLTHRVPDAGFGAKHEVEHGLAVVEAIGAKTTDRLLDLPISSRDQTAAEHLISHQFFPAVRPAMLNPQQTTDPRLLALRPIPDRIVAVHPGSGSYSPARRWPLERWEQLGQALITRGAHVLIVGTSGDGGRELGQRLPAATDLTGKTTLLQLASVLQNCDLFVGADSGVMHVACAAGARVVALFGTTNPKAWGPWTAPGHSVVVASETPGCPCAYIGFRLPSKADEQAACMEGIGVERVLEAINGLIGASMPR